MLNYDFTFWIAIASLLVSVLSFIYARKAYQFEVAKFKFEQSSQDVFLDFPDTLVSRHFDLSNLENPYTVLENNVLISNKSSASKLAVYFNIMLYFGFYGKKPAISNPPKLKLTMGLLDSRALSAGLTEIFNFIESQESIRMVIVDAETNQRVTFSPDKMMKIEPEPHSYSWKVYTIIPNSVIEYLSSQNISLDLVEMELMLHPREWKYQSSYRFRHGSIQSSEVFQHLFPDEQLLNKHKAAYPKAG
jgi:hypothetical protein